MDPFHLQDATIEKCNFPITDQTSSGNMAILLDNVAFDNVKTPVMDTTGKAMLGSSGLPNVFEVSI